MMTIYERFRNSSLDLSPLGLQEQASGAEACYIPSNAHVLGWLTDSPVCFYLSDGDNTVYAAAPCGLPGEQVLPVARNILDFIGLLVRCKDASLIANAYQWSSIRFRELLNSKTAGIKAGSVIRALENTYHPPVIDEPGEMLLQLRKDFQSAAEDRDVNWKVAYSSDFSSGCIKGKAGKELILNKTLRQAEGVWHVPAVYLCENGIVADVFLEVPVSRLEEYRNRWDGDSSSPLSYSDKLQRQLDDPLAAAVTSILTVNDKPISCKKSFSAIWNPLTENSAHVRHILNHYRLNPNCGYLFRRYCFPRKGKQPQIRSMQLTLEAVAVMVPDLSFIAQEAGERLRFTNPCNGMEHTFTVVSLSHEAINPNFLTNHPCCYTRLTYALEPSISPEIFQVVDQNPGDHWDGYQDDPASVIYAGRRPEPGRYALSALHYEPQKQVQWQMIFRRKLHEDRHLSLLP